MNISDKQRITRRKFIVASMATATGISLLPLYCFNPKSSLNAAVSTQKLPLIMKRKFGGFNFEVTTMGLGGQAAIQLTPSGTDAATIIVKAVKLGVNYFDTSNVYGASQENYNKAFIVLKLIPGVAGYDENLRKSIWITSKTKMAWGKPGYPERPNVTNTSNGANVKCAVDDLKRSLTIIFGDGKGYYPEGAYLDMILMHSIKSFETNDVLYEGLETPLDPKGNFGALVALRDYRDGTNLTGMNPKKEKLVRHIGFSGHSSPPVMVDLIQRDEYGILEAMLVPVNPNDKTKYCMQHNVIPVASAKGMGIIAMKVFADACLYSNRTPNWSSSPADLFMEVGTPELPSKSLIEYTLTTPGVHTAIMGIGHIDVDPLRCQLVRNFTDAQIEPSGQSETERTRLETLTKTLKPNSNYFQMPKVGLTKPGNLRKEGDKLLWDNAFAGDSPVAMYEILINGKKVGEVAHQPQTHKSKPFVYEVSVKPSDKVEVVSVDKSGSRAAQLLVVNSADELSELKKTLLYPNPVQNELTISGIPKAVSVIAIYDAVGKKLIEKEVKETQVKVDVSKFQRGIHFVKFPDGSSEKFVKL